MSEPDPEAAKRLARLLLAEIKLVETYKLERGIRTKNILGSLDNEISSARKKFSQTYGHDSALSIFDEQVLLVLADGDQSLLGNRIG